MLYEIETLGEINSFANKLQKLVNEPSLRAVIVLVAENNEWTAEVIDPLVKNRRIPVLGGIYPKLLMGKTVLERGALLLGVTVQPHIAIIPKLSAPQADFEDAIDYAIGSEYDCEETITDFSSYSRIGAFGQTTLVFFDGLSPGISPFVEGLFNVLGVEENYIGGGAGSASLEKMPCLITPEGLLQDAAMLVGLNWHSGVGVAHGWERVAGSYIVTEAEGAIVKTINWRPAVDVYCEAIAAQSDKEITKENLLEHTASYPLGLIRLGGDYIVRDPYKIIDDTIVFMGEVPSQSHVDLLHGKKNKLIEAAQAAQLIAKSSFPKEFDPTASFVLNCISRQRFLQDDFKEELAAVQLDKIPVFGALTLGEIANTGGEHLELYNKATVVGIVGTS